LIIIPCRIEMEKVQKQIANSFLDQTGYYQMNFEWKDIF